MPGLLVTATALLLYVHATSDALPDKMKVNQALEDRHPKEEEYSEYWLKEGEEMLERQLEAKTNTGVAKNVILFLGDGMSVATVTAARIYGGQLLGRPGEEFSLSFDSFPHTGFSKTYCVDRQVADSACSATAYLCGVKAALGTLGVTAAVRRKDCQAVDRTTSVPSILARAQAEGKSTGIVTTTRVTHASPAGAYAHTANRDWESDADVVDSSMDPEMCPDIASQLINNLPGRGINVILGGGRREFRWENATDEEGQPGRRLGEADLIAQWKADKGGSYVTNRDQLLAVDTNTTDYLLGLFAPSHMEYHLGSENKSQPTLSEMTRVALQILSRNPKGFFLFVEGGRIDHGHHETMARRALDETVEFSEAVRAAESMVGEDTLRVVTADHSHTMTFSGYPGRGQPILGPAGLSDVDGLPYTTLSYANGPGYRKPRSTGERHNILEDDTEDMKYHFPSGLPTGQETHGGEDVGVYAKGPWSHLLSGVYQQSYIPFAIMYASCIPPFGCSNHCNSTSSP